MAGEQSHWVIEDSEEEDQLCNSEIDGPPSVISVIPEDGATSISAFTSIVAEKNSRISSLETAPPTHSTISSFPPRPQTELSTISESSAKSDSRLHPLSIFNRTDADPVANTPVDYLVPPHMPTSNDTKQSTIVTHSDPTEATTTTEIPAHALKDFSQDIAERTKMRTRKAAKRPTRYTEEVIDITDDEIALKPTQKPKARPKPRPIKRAVPTGNDPQMLTDAVTIPMPSSSLPLPPSDPFPESTVINSTPPRPRDLDEVAIPDSSPRRSPENYRKRKHRGRLQSPIDGLTFPSYPPIPQPNMPSHEQEFLPHVAEVSTSTSRVNLEKNVDRVETVGESDSDSSMSARHGRSEAGQYHKKAKTVVEVVIMSPRKKRNKKIKASRKGSSSGSKNDYPVSSSVPGKSPAQWMNDEDAHLFHQQMSDGDDELILAPERKPSAGMTSRKEKQRFHGLQSEDNSAPTEGESVNERVTVVGEEDSRKSDHQPEGVSRSSTDKHRKSRSYSVEPESPLPLKENVRPVVPTQGDDPPNLRQAKETSTPRKLRYTLSRFDRKTPMQELIRRAASHPSAPFSVSSSPIASPLAKSTKSALRRIAPLHPTRRTPPPPLPPPPPPKKSSKMLKLEEKWELELEDEVEGWWALTDVERQDWRKAKRDKELGYDD